MIIRLKMEQWQDKDKRASGNLVGTKTTQGKVKIMLDLQYSPVPMLPNIIRYVQMSKIAFF